MKAVLCQPFFKRRKPIHTKNKGLFWGALLFLACRFCWHINHLQGSLYCHPKHCILKGKSLKITIHWHCFDPPQVGNLMTPALKLMPRKAKKHIKKQISWDRLIDSHKVSKFQRPPRSRPLQVTF